MNTSNHKNLVDFLKASIQDRHARMEKLPFIAALTRCDLPLESYVGQLRAMAVIHGTLEHEFSLLSSPELKALLQEMPSRLEHLRKDLDFFEHQSIPDIAAAEGHTRKFAERIRRCRVEQPKDLIGILYVFQGMTLGNTVHLGDVNKTFGSRIAGKAHYYTGYGEKTLSLWKKFTLAMNEIPCSKDERGRIEQAALDTFDQLEALYSVFYPLHSGSPEYSAGMLNPEAGDHPVPGDVKEIEAAVQAARKCREEFPYFDERYGERGRSFAKSDSAWLTTLPDLPKEQLTSQVFWLGRVLASRGMPRITMERQLELLFEELKNAVPGKKDQYAGLLKGAEELRKERLSFITGPDFEALAKEFSASTDAALHGRFKKTGDLIVSAACDEACGIPEAVTSLISWLTDENRFTQKWISAVNKTLASARAKIEEVRK